MNFDYTDDEEQGALPIDHPTALNLAAEEMPWKPKTPFPVARYLDAIETLRERGYSFAEIADWLNTKLAAKLKGTTITRAQVYHAFRYVLERDSRSLQEAINSGEPIGITSISDEEAEAKAAAADGEPLKKVETAKRIKRTIRKEKTQKK